MKPQRVREAAAEADRRIQEMAAANAPADPGDPEGSEAATDTEATAQEPTQQAEDSSPSAEPESGTADAERLQAELEKADQRNRTLDGMIRARDRELQETRQRLDALEAQLQEQASQPQQPEQPAWSDSDEDTFGADLVRYIHDVAERVAAKALGSLPDEVAKLKSGLDQTSQMTAVSAQDTFETKLTKLSPNWRELDADQAFIDWLEARPTLHRTMHAAVKALDAQGVADVFNTYAELTQVRSDSKADKRRRELEDQAAPPKQRQTSPAAVEQEPENLWTRSEIEQVYRTKRGRDGRQLTPEEWDAIQREIAAAQAQGRVDFSR